MSIEKPWKNEFNELLSELSTFHKGFIKSPKSNKPGYFLIADTEDFFYPTFYGEMGGFKFSVENSEVPPLDSGQMIANDNVEYLRIQFIKKHNCDIMFSSDTWINRLLNKLKIKNDIQTGIQEIDRIYRIKVKSDLDKQLLSDFNFQQLIIDLQPFIVLKISGSFIQFNQTINNRSQLKFEPVNNYITKMFELTKLIPSK